MKGFLPKYQKCLPLIPPAEEVDNWFWKKSSACWAFCFHATFSMPSMTYILWISLLFFWFQWSKNFFIFENKPKNSYRIQQNWFCEILLNVSLVNFAKEHVRDRMGFPLGSYILLFIHVINTFEIHLIYQEFAFLT